MIIIAIITILLIVLTITIVYTIRKTNGKGIILGTPGSGKAYHWYDNIHDYSYLQQERLYVEFLLIRLWFKNKKEDSVYSFEPVNIRTEENPYWINGIKYDMSERSNCSAAILYSTATDDKLLIRSFHKDEDYTRTSFDPACCFKTHELQQLVSTLYQNYPTNISPV